MLINAIDPEESRIAVVEDGVLQELHVELANREAYLGNIYKGKVVNIEPSIGAAFVAFGGRVNGFLHVSDVLPAYGRPDFVLDDVIEGRARVDVDDSPESMQQALVDDDEDDGAPAEGGKAASDEPAEAPVEESNVTVAEGDHDDAEPVDPREQPPAEDDDDDADDAEPADDDADVPPADGNGNDDDDGPGFGDGIHERPLPMAASGGDGVDDDGGDQPPAAGDVAAPATAPNRRRRRRWRQRPRRQRQRRQRRRRSPRPAPQPSRRP
jgi:ribonuclease E